MIGAALRLAEHGFAVFPCRERDKVPTTKSGFKAATTDAGVVEAWWSQRPNANIGIACGASGIVVIDVDPRHGGDESLAVLRSQIPGLGETVTALTGGGGMHLYFRAPVEPVRDNNTGLLGDGIDVKSSGGYVIAPSSVHESGRAYCWEVGYAPGEVAMAQLPAAIVERLKTPAKPVSAPVANAEMIPSGKRNATLASVAGTMRRRGLGYDEIFAALAAMNARRCDPPLPETDIQTIAKSIARYAPETPLVDMRPKSDDKPDEVQPAPVGRAFITSWSKPIDARRYSTSIPRLDEVLNFLHPGEMTLVGAWTGVGKSGFSEMCALEIGKKNSVLFLPLELGIERTERRMVAKLMKTSEEWVDHIQSDAHEGSRQNLYDAVEELQDRKIEMLATSVGDDLSYEQIRDLIIAKMPDVVIIDHLQHIADWTPAANKRSDLNAAKIVRDLRKIAEHYRVHIICIHQLKAEKIQKRQRPHLYDFADTAALPRVADTVLALHRPFRGLPSRDTVMEILVMKNRRGPEPWIHCHFVGDYIGILPMTKEESNEALCCRGAA